MVVHGSTRQLEQATIAPAPMDNFPFFLDSFLESHNCPPV